jgi:hypothetical protein
LRRLPVLVRRGLLWSLLGSFGVVGGRCGVLVVVVPRRVLAYNPWKKEIDKSMSDLEPKCLILSGFMQPRERMLNLVPTLAVAKTWVENNSIVMSIERRMLS